MLPTVPPLARPPRWVLRQPTSWVDLQALFLPWFSPVANQQPPSSGWVLVLPRGCPLPWDILYRRSCCGVPAVALAKKSEVRPSG